MKLLAHHSKTTEFTRDLTDEETGLLKGYASLGSEYFKAKQSVLAEVHASNSWIECDCIDDQKPVMGVRFRDSYYHLFNMHKRGNHLEQCALHRLPKDNNADIQEIKKDEKKKNSFVFHFESREQTPSTKNNIGGSKKSESENSLWVCLRRLIILSGVDEIGGSLGLSYSARKQAILKTMRVLKVGGVSMSKVSRWGLSRHDQLCDMITTITEEKAMPKGAPHGVMISVIDGLKINDKKQVVLKNGEDRVVLPASCTVEVNGKHGYEISPPYLCIYTVLNTSEKDEEIICEPQKCFITPIHSVETLIPTSTELDRILIDKAISNYRFNLKKDIEIKYQKPLYPYISPNTGRKVSPSLVVKNGKSEVFIDIDPPITEENRLMIERRLEAMYEIADIVRIPICNEMEDFEDEAFNAVSLAAKFVLGIGR